MPPTTTEETSNGEVNGCTGVGVTSGFRKRRLSLNATTVLAANAECDTDEPPEQPLEQNDDDNNQLKKVKANDQNSPQQKKSVETNVLEAKEIGHNLTLDEASKLPFPRSKVGIYSCPGLEPLYEEDAEEQDKDGNSDDDEVPVKCVAKINQDRGSVAYPYGKNLRCALFSVYDGHGEDGDLVSQYTMSEIHNRLEEHAHFKTDLARSFHEIFTSVNEDLKYCDEIEAIFSGTTACVAILRNNKITISNVGDSRAVIARRNKDDVGEGSNNLSLSAIDLSVDQNPDSPEEQARIERSGGFVSPPPEEGLSARVWLDADHTQVGLAMSRSIGDHAVKTVGVIADPVVSEHDVLPSDEFIILGSDGIWEFLSSQDAVNIVSQNFANGKDASAACEDLIENAAMKWREFEGDYRDDITAVIVRLDQLWSD